MKANNYLIFGIIMLAVGITMLMTGAVSKPIAYGDCVIAFALFALALQKSKDSGSENRDQ